MTDDELYASVREQVSKMDISIIRELWEGEMKYPWDIYEDLDECLVDNYGTDVYRAVKDSVRNNIRLNSNYYYMDDKGSGVHSIDSLGDRVSFDDITDWCMREQEMAKKYGIDFGENDE